MEAQAPSAQSAAAPPVPPELAAALVEAQKEFANAIKNKTNPHLRNKYADLAACLEAVSEPLNKHGIALVQRTLDGHGVQVCVETLFIHKSGACFSGGTIALPALKNDPQGYGSALTYARRYSLMAACGIAQEDDDGNGGPFAKDPASGDGAPKAAPPKTPPPLPPYPEDSFASNFPKWCEAVMSGRQTPEAVAATVGTKYALTEAQRARIAAIQRPPV